MRLAPSSGACRRVRVLTRRGPLEGRGAHRPAAAVTCTVPVKLVLLPGLDGTGNLFGPLLDALPRDIDAQVIAYPADAVLSVRELADLVARRIAGNRPVVLLAESFSGLVCIELLRRRIAPIKAVVFSACFAGPPRPWLHRVARCLPLSSILRLPIPGAVIERYGLGPGADPAAVQLVKSALAGVEPAVLAGRLRELGRPRQDPGRIALPCAYIQATADRLVPRGALEAFKSAAPDIEVHEIPGPHFLLQAQPAHCAAVVAAFVRRHRGMDSRPDR